MGQGRWIWVVVGRSDGLGTGLDLGGEGSEVSRMT